MTLRSVFPIQQLLSAAACGLFLLAGAANGQDVIIKQDGTQQLGKIMGSSAAGIQIQIGTGSMITIPMAQAKEARMGAVPPEFALAQKAAEQKQYDAELTQLKALEKYKGLPAEWAQQAAGMIGDVYLDKGDIPKAEAAYAEYQKLYPGGVQADLGLAKLAVAKKDFATAKAKVEPIIAKANEEKNPSRVNGFAYSQAFLLMGQIKESENAPEEALADYLKAVTIFYYDRNAATLAQEKADALRKANPNVFIP